MAYDLELEIKEVLEKINFVERYKALSEKFSNSENTFENYENEKLLKYSSLLAIKLVTIKSRLFIVGEIKQRCLHL